MGFPAGVKRLVLAVAGVPVAVTMTTVMLAGPASAAPRSVQAAQVAAAPSSHVYRTKVKGLRVRATANASAKVLAVLGAAGTSVTVNCYALGTAIGGDTVWYHITAPHAGYVAGFYLNTGRDPAAGIPRC